MVERAPQTKQDEQYPLLKVDGGGGDGGVHPQPPTLVTPGWGVTCAPKQSWLVRWPEYVSVCWMTLILLGISFLVFYALGMEAYRRQPVLIIKCNSSKPASDVFFHHIVPRGRYAPFMLYAEHLSSIATQYPQLHFHVYFLMDDSLQTAFHGPRHTRFINKLIPYPPSNMYTFSKLDDNCKRDLIDFQKRYQNVNITVMSLSKYMAMTPLKYKWRTIPLSSLPFYARIFSVWQNGGVGMDLNTFNNNFNTRQHLDRRISTILKQHNDGIKVEEYTNALNKIDREEECEFFTNFYGLIHQILNETRTFLSKSFPFPQITTEKGSPVNELSTRASRHKRELAITTTDKNNKSENASNVYVEIINSTNDTDLKRNEYQTLSNADVNPNKLTVNINDIKTPVLQSNISDNISDTNKLDIMNKTEIQSEISNKSDSPQVVLFYDFSLFSDGIAPSYVLPEPLIRQDFRQNVRSEYGKPGKFGNIPIHLLSMDSDGLFVAASSRLHPFLGHLISAGCQRMPPKFAIQDTLLTQCSGIFKEDTYCNNIYIL